MATDSDARRQIVLAHADHVVVRHHDVAHLQVGHIEHAFDHRQCVGIEQPVLGGILQRVAQLLAILRGGKAPDTTHHGCGL